MISAKTLALSFFCLPFRELLWSECSVLSILQGSFLLIPPLFLLFYFLSSPLEPLLIKHWTFWIDLPYPVFLFFSYFTSLFLKFCVLEDFLSISFHIVNLICYHIHLVFQNIYSIFLFHLLFLFWLWCIYPIYSILDGLFYYRCFILPDF